MHLKFICCDVFLRIACGIVAESPHIVDVEFMPMLAHNNPDKLNKELQERIDKSSKVKRYDKIILGYGLCGNSTVGLHSSVPLILPRAHDCCMLFMGSKERYLEGFGDALSMRWRTCGYHERCDVSAAENLNQNGYYNDHSGSDGVKQHAAYMTSTEYMDLVDKYGEENADYVWETLHPDIETDEAAYIEVDGYEYSGSYEWFKTDVESQGKTVRHLKGDISFLKQLINGPWDEKHFLEIMPGQKVAGVYDMDIVIKAAKL